VDSSFSSATFLRGGYRLRVDFDFSGNLQSGAAVKISGIKIGKVEDVQFMGGAIDPETKRRVQVRVTAFVENRAHEAIRQNAEFFVNTQGVLGEQYLEISTRLVRETAARGKCDRARRRSAADRSDRRAPLRISRQHHLAPARRQGRDPRLPQVGAASCARSTRSSRRTAARSAACSSTSTRSPKGLAADGLDPQRRRRLVAAARDPGQRRSAHRRGQTRHRSMAHQGKKALDGVTNLTSVIGPGERDKLVKALDELTTVRQQGAAGGHRRAV